MKGSSEKANLSAARSKSKLTPHHAAAANPKVKELSKLLRRRWRSAGSEERTARIAELCKLGCSIRGIAKDIDVPETTLRRYAEVVPTKASRSKSKAKAVSGPSKSEQVAAADAQASQAPVSSKQKLGGPEGAALPARRTMRELPPKPELLVRLKLEREAAKLESQKAESQDGLEPQESLRSLRERLPEVMVDLISTTLGPPGGPRWKAQIQNVIRTLNYFAKIMPFKLIRHFPREIARSELYRLTRPAGFNGVERLDGEDLGVWVASLGFSLFHAVADGPAWEEVIDQVVQEISPRPPNGYRDYHR